MVILLGLTAAALYGTADFVGGLASRSVRVLGVLTLANVAAVSVAIPAAALSAGQARLAGLAWGAASGLVGGIGLIIFFTGLASGPMSVVAPVSGLVSVVLPVAVALGWGERPGAAAFAGALLCLAAVVLSSSTGKQSPGSDVGPASPGRRWPGRAIGYGVASGTAFGLFFLLIRNAGQSGALWPVAAGRVGELVAILAAAAALRRSPLPRGTSRTLLLAVVGSGVIDMVANICYVEATRTGMFGLAVVLASLYPGVTVLLARVMLGERLRWVQRAGLGLAAIGILLVSA